MKKLLTKMVEQFREAHEGGVPDRIVVEPVALVALGIKRSVAPVWNGIPVECREIKADEAVAPGSGKKLAVVYDPVASQIRAYELS